MLATPDDFLEEAHIRPGRVEPVGREPVVLPGPMTRLDRLSGRHKARRYLVGLGLDPDRVGRAYGVGYCGAAAESLARDRIIVPYRLGGEVRGWQALAIGSDGLPDSAGLPEVRIYTAPGMRVSEAVYNLDHARRYRAGIIVATPVDVWRFGPMAMSLPGAVPTERQWRSIAAVFRDRPVVLLVNAGRLERPNTGRMIRFFSQRLLGRFAVVTLPAHPGRQAFDRGSLRDLVVEEAAGQGIKVRYKKTT